LIKNVRGVQAHYQGTAESALQDLAAGALAGTNLFEILMETTKVATLGQISAALYEVGGQYRRNM
jgi:methylmalonyl-CoA mutase